MVYKIYVLDRKYENWSVADSTSLETIDISMNPIKNKLFNGDAFNIDKSTLTIIHSPFREILNIPGVLVLIGNKTYGKYKKKYLYRCIPDDRRLPEFLIPYQIKIGFSKNIFNKYIIFKYKNWDNKHPHGQIIQIIGDVTNLNNFYEYQLYCKSLYASIQQFTKNTKNALRKKSSDFYIKLIQNKYNLEDRKNWKIYSIDPTESRDFDDAFSIKKTGDTILLSIYISNVSMWLDILGLWDSFSQRIATIYLPDRKRPMLPTILSDTLCSLLEQNTRFAFTLDIEIQNGIIINTTFKNTSIIITKNFIYESPELKKCKDYKILLDVIKQMDKNVNDSHDAIAYIMVLMNSIAGEKLENFKCGIFRSIQLKKLETFPQNLPPKVLKFIKTWNSSGSRYVRYDEYRNHDLLQKKSYVHITSPIRRLVDLLNMLLLQDKLDLVTFNNKSKKFYTHWFAKLDYINTTMQAIRKVQNDCSLLNRCIQEKNPEYLGYIFNKIERNDGLLQYMVYLPNLKMVNRFICQTEYNNFSKHLFKIYIFMDEDRLKHRIRIEIILSY